MYSDTTFRSGLSENENKNMGYPGMKRLSAAVVALALTGTASAVPIVMDFSGELVSRSTSHPGEPIEFDGYSVAVGNSRAFGGGMFIAPHAELDDGLLDVITVSNVGKLRYLRGLPKAFKGTHLENDEVSEHRGATVEIRSNRDFAVYADGEHLTDLPVTLRVLPRALTVIAPPGPFAGPPA